MILFYLYRLHRALFGTDMMQTIKQYQPAAPVSGFALCLAT